MGTATKRPSLTARAFCPLQGGCPDARRVLRYVQGEHSGMRGVCLKPVQGGVFVLQVAHEGLVTEFRSGGPAHQFAGDEAAAVDMDLVA